MIIWNIKYLYIEKKLLKTYAFRRHHRQKNENSLKKTFFATIKE